MRACVAALEQEMQQGVLQPKAAASSTNPPHALLTLCQDAWRLGWEVSCFLGSLIPIFLTLLQLMTVLR